MFLEDILLALIENLWCQSKISVVSKLLLKLVMWPKHPVKNFGYLVEKFEFRAEDIEYPIENFQFRVKKFKYRVNMFEF